MPIAGGGPERRWAEALRRLRSPNVAASELHQHKIKERRPHYVASTVIRIDKRAPSWVGAAIL
jgi:hypothetical protein